MDTVKKLSAFSLFSVLIMATVWNFEAAAVNPALGSIQAAFPNEPASAITLISTIPFIGSVIFSTIAGRLANYFDKKKIAVFGLALYGISGILPAFFTNMTMILILRALTGIGVGLVLPIPAMILAEHYEGARRDKVMGYMNAVFNVSNGVVSIIVGLMLGIGWQVSFYAFIFIFVVLLLVLIACPKSPPDKTVVEAQAHKEKIKLPGYAYLMLLAMLLLWIAFSGLLLTLAMYIVATEIVPLQFIGIFAAIPGTLSAVAALVFPFVCKFRYRFIAVALLILAGGFYAASNSTTPIMLAVACALIGFGQGMLVPYVISSTVNNVPEAAKDASLGLVQAGIHAGSLIGGFAVTSVMALNEANPFGYAYMLYAVVILITAVVFFAGSFFVKKKVLA